jgi:hypothetical protein
MNDQHHQPEKNEQHGPAMYDCGDGRDVQLAGPDIQSTLEARGSNAGQNRGRYRIMRPERVLIAHHLPTPLIGVPVHDWLQAEE